jgi:UDP-N-acetylmuramyl pentapeptide phosphotransferase/UDP-N-acetylglucosamine-1-phosphate transferase/GT2 family glycosyltransferase
MVYVHYVAILLTVSICLFARPLGSRLGVIDHPDGGRKRHPAPTPQIGGVAIMAAVVASCLGGLVLEDAAARDLYLAILCCGGGIAVVGFMDDQHTISPSGRLILLAIFSAVALKLDPALMTAQLHTNTFGLIPISPAMFVAVVVVALVGFSSAVNMVDGVNGLIMIFVCIWSACVAIAGGDAVRETALVVGAGSLVTLLFNLRGRLFLGDCGTFSVAFVLGLLAIACHNVGHLPLEAAIVWFFIPVVDCLRLIPLRLSQGRSPFRPDKNHFHHRLAARLGDQTAVAICGCIVAVTSLGVTLDPGSAQLCLILLTIFYAGFLLVDAYVWNRFLPDAARSNNKRSIKRVTIEPKTMALQTRLNNALRRRIRRVRSLRLDNTIPKPWRTAAPVAKQATDDAPIASAQQISRTMPPYAPRKWGPSLEYRTGDGGIIALSFLSMPGQTASFSLRDQFGNMHATKPLDIRVEPLNDPIMSDTLPADMQEHVKSGGSLELTQVVLEAPTELLDGRSGKAAIHARFGADQVIIPDVIMENGRNVEITSFALENNSVSFSGQFKRKQPGALKLGLYIDGALSTQREFKLADNGFRGSFLIDDRHLDGAVHQIELRLLPEMTLLASTYELVPMQITPWAVLQFHARPPMDASLAPAARHHFRSFQLWFEKIQTGIVERMPPLSMLHAELLRGFNKRSAYPRLEFPEPADPKVSIVVPAHDKFEVTYFCLCALLFAYNDTSFEVIVVDDGSSDETLRIKDFIGGIRVVRHEKSTGFVDACNDGAAVAKGEFVAFLNNDTEVTARWLDELVAAFADFNGVGLVGSKLVYPNGQLQEAGGIVWNNGNPWNVGRNGSPADPRYNYLREVDYLSAAAILLPRALWTEVGGFSPEMAPAYFEDTDLAMKVREAGRHVVYVPTSTVYHFEGQSAGTDAAIGMKRFQEINRPKFREKWRHRFETHGAEGKLPDREKDRSAAFRVLFVERAFPTVDIDAGSYAAFQEIRLFQSLGAKVTFLPRNLAWMDRHTHALERIGVECIHAPFVTDFVGFLRAHAKDYDLIYTCRHYIARQVLSIVKSVSPSTRVIVNLADLHFLREMREAAAGTPGYTLKKAEATRGDELGVIASSDLTFSYSDVELAVLESHLGGSAPTAKLPWVVETKAAPRRFGDTKDILFLGGFAHPPNEQAVRFFATKVMPQARIQIGDVVFNVAGSQPTQTLSTLASESVRILGYVEHLDDVFDSARIFVAPLLAGAGLKGKVLEAMSRGVPSVLSPVAAEGTGLIHNIDCLIARTPDEWINAVTRLYSDEELWTRIATAALRTAEARFSLSAGVEMFASALARIGVSGRMQGNLIYKHTRPQRYG